MALSKLRIKKNDTVRVMTGRDRGQQGKVTQVFPRERLVVVEGVNLRYKHLKGRRGQAGSRVQYAAPLSANKLMVLCPQCSKITRLQITLAADGRKLRVCHRCKQPLTA